MSTKKGSSGFTIVEMLVATVTISALSLSVAVLLDSVRTNQQKTWENYLKVDEANTSIKSMSRELRTARHGDNGAYVLEKAGDNEIIFHSDMDFDGNVEKVRYTLTGNELYKGVIEPVGYPVTYPPTKEVVTLVTANVRNQAEAIFYYFNGDWPTDTANNPLQPADRISDTRLVRIYLRLNTEDQATKDYILENYVQIRMLKDNL